MNLKPVGAKRQWWLMPLDALFVVYPLDNAFDVLKDYQRNPCVENAVKCYLAAESTRDFLSLDDVVRVFEHGAQKYAPDNWKQPYGNKEAIRREYFSAMCRHLQAESPVDEESGIPHVAHAACCALILLWHEMRWEDE